MGPARVTGLPRPTDCRGPPPSGSVGLTVLNIWPTRPYSSTSPHFSSLLFSLCRKLQRARRRRASDESYVGRHRSQLRDGGTRAFLVINFDLIRHLGFLDPDRSAFSILILHISSPFRSFHTGIHSLVLTTTRNGTASSSIPVFGASAAFHRVAMLRATSTRHLTWAAGSLDAVFRAN